MKKKDLHKCEQVLLHYARVLLLLDGCLGGGEACYWHAEWRA